MNFLRKYPNLNAARVRSDAELAADLNRVMHVIDTHPDPNEGVRLTVVRDWIAQALSLRHRWGIDPVR
jgi:hypothetical protein